MVYGETPSEHAWSRGCCSAQWQLVTAENDLIPEDNQKCDQNEIHEIKKKNYWKNKNLWLGHKSAKLFQRCTICSGNLKWK